jgi:hypothetical protein
MSGNRGLDRGFLYPCGGFKQGCNYIYWRIVMKRKATAILAFVAILSMAALPAKVYSINDEYESLEFFLDQALRGTKDADQRTEILNRYLIKALGLVYRQNKELIRLQRQTLDAMQELRDTEKKEMRELEIQLQKSQ